MSNPEILKMYKNALNIFTGNIDQAKQATKAHFTGINNKKLNKIIRENVEEGVPPNISNKPIMNNHSIILDPRLNFYNPKRLGRDDPTIFKSIFKWHTKQG